MRTVRVEAWEVLGVWQISVSLVHQSDGQAVDARCIRAAATTVPDFDSDDIQAVAVLQSAVRMIQDLGWERLSGGSDSSVAFERVNPAVDRSTQVD